VGFETRDDAAVYRLSSEICIISTADFITPPVDDPYWFGQIAAANSLSDVYAMGGRPVIALNLVMFPAKELDIGILKEIMRGGADKVLEAGASMAGGHSVDDAEPKYGLAVTGVVHPSKILRNSTARAGDELILTKPLGTGVLFNALRAGKLPWGELESLLTQIAALNRTAIETAAPFDVSACTDITGFGLAGHACEMAMASSASMEIYHKQLPIYPHAAEMYKKGVTTGTNEAVRRFSEGILQIKAALPKDFEGLLFDPQTSGGLLLAVKPGDAASLVDGLRRAGVAHAASIGRISETGVSPCIRIL
jgi:selenide,water dikinase